MSSPSCADCRHHASRIAPKPHKNAEEFMDGTYFVVDDEGQKVYSCRGPASSHYGKEIGPVPVHCESWAGAQGRENDHRDQRMRDMILAWEARQKAREAQR